MNSLQIEAKSKRANLANIFRFRKFNHGSVQNSSNDFLLNGLSKTAVVPVKT